MQPGEGFSGRRDISPRSSFQVGPVAIAATSDYVRSPTRKRTGSDRSRRGARSRAAIVINAGRARAAGNGYYPRGTKDICSLGPRAIRRCPLRRRTHVTHTRDGARAREPARTRVRGHASRARLTVPADIFRFRSPGYPPRPREARQPLNQARASVRA